MNLKEFINYRFTCPICDFPLSISFHSKKWQSIKYEEDRLVVMVKMNALKRKQKDYKITYSFGLNDNSWFINFFSKEEKPIDQETPNFLRDRFKELNKNLSLYRFYKHCQNCNRYTYSTNYFDLNFKTANLGELEIIYEYFGLFRPNPNGDGYRIYELINKPHLNETVISYGLANHADFPPNVMHFQNLTIPLIKFSSKDETLERIQKLIVFS